MGVLGGRFVDWGCGGLVSFGFVLGFHCGSHCGWVGARGSWICWSNHILNSSL